MASALPYLYSSLVPWHRRCLIFLEPDNGAIKGEAQQSRHKLQEIKITFNMRVLGVFVMSKLSFGLCNYSDHRLKKYKVGAQLLPNVC